MWSYAIVLTEICTGAQPERGNYQMPRYLPACLPAPVRLIGVMMAAVPLACWRWLAHCCKKINKSTPFGVKGNRESRRIVVFSCRLLRCSEQEKQSSQSVACCRVPDEAPQHILDLIRECMHQDPSQRPTAKQAILRITLEPQPDAGQ